jgi:hypothetical protein
MANGTMNRLISERPASLPHGVYVLLNIVRRVHLTCTLRNCQPNFPPPPDGKYRPTKFEISRVPIVVEIIFDLEVILGASWKSF